MKRDDETQRKGWAAFMRDPVLAERYEALREKYFTEGDKQFLPPARDVTIEWSNRLTASAGVCYPQRRTIRLSTHYHATHPEEVDSTLLHEMIHLLVPGHGKPFWEWMARIQAKGGRVSRHSKERATPPSSARWRYRCTRCGASFERRRRLPHGGRTHVHRGCGGPLEESELPRRERGGNLLSAARRGVGRSDGRAAGERDGVGADARGRSSRAFGAYAGEARDGRAGLVWPGKEAAMRAAELPPAKQLLSVGGRSGRPEPTRNVLVEGDNLDALKLLHGTHAGRVKLVYIDPPYNTGKRFVYRDRFRRAPATETAAARDEGDEAAAPRGGSGSRSPFAEQHAPWLSMMAPRLLLARDLLQDDGVIAIHIDEHELHNLLHLLAELYGEENHLGTLVWDKRNPKGDATGIAYQHESIVVYAKDRDACVGRAPLRRPKENAERILQKAAELFGRLGRPELPSDLASVAQKYGLPASVVERYRADYTLERVNEEFAAWVRSQEQFSGGERAYNRIDANGDVYRLVSMAWPNKQRAPDGYFTPLVHPVTGRPCPVPARGWRYAPATMRRLVESGEVVFGPDERVQPQRKYLLKDNLTEAIPSVLRFGGSDDVMLKELGIPFENPKPVRLAMELISYFARRSGDVVVDLFAGSGTTGHAVLELNRTDGRDRRFLLVQSPEPTDARSAARAAGFATVFDMTRARLERVYARLGSEATVPARDGERGGAVRHRGADFDTFRVAD